jgi:serine O-acetyltransferase
MTIAQASSVGSVAATWHKLTQEATTMAERHGSLASVAKSAILERASFADALCEVLVGALERAVPQALSLRPVFERVLTDRSEIAEAAAADLEKLAAVNPACPDLLTGFLSFRGFQAVQVYRINHALWAEGQEQMAVLLQNWGAMVFAIDIHPAAKIGSAVFVDHGIGLVVGSTAVIEDGANIWHGVTLGSTLTQAGDRHPKVRRNATLCAGATVLGNIEIGEGAIVAAGSVVLKPVEAGAVVAGVPAKVVGVAPSRLDAIDEGLRGVSRAEAAI